MIKIENISVSKRYAISLYFDKNYTKENIIFGEDSAKQSFFGNEDGESYEKERFKRNFGEIIEDGLLFSKSDDLPAVRKCADGLADVLLQGKGNREIEPYKAELFRIYNGSDNIIERYVILKLWHTMLVAHKEINSFANTMRKKQWEQIGTAYGEFADRMLMPFEKRFTSVEDVVGCSGQARIETFGTDCVYTFEDDILPLYVLYLTELARHGKMILTCEICGRYFVAARKDTKVCGAECKAKRQSAYFKEHKEKVKDDELDRLYQRNRDGYDNFRKKLAKMGASDEVMQRYLDRKYAFLNEGKRMRKLYREGKVSDRELTEFVQGDAAARMRLEGEILG